MVSNRVLLGSVAFGMGLAIALVTSRDFGKAVGTGAIAVPAVLVATGIVNRRQRQQGESRLEALTDHIRVLQQRRLEEYEAFLHLSTERQRLETHQYMPPATMRPVPSLAGSPTAIAQIGPAAQPSPMMALMAPRKPALSWDLSAPPPAIPTLDLSPHTLPTQIQDPPSRDPDDLSKFLADKKSAKRKIEAKLNALQAEYAQVQVNLKEERIALERLTQEVQPLKQQKQALEADMTGLRQAIAELTQRRDALQPAIAAPAPTPKAKLPTVTLVTVPLVAPKSVTTHRPAVKVASPGGKTSEFPEDWRLLMQQLPEHEFQVLKAIAEPGNSAPTIKKIAEANLTMPELLIDAINERALDTMGDLILASEGNAVAIAPEYRQLVTKLIQAYEF